MQQLKMEIIEAQKERINKHLNGKIHEQLDFNIRPYIEGNEPLGMNLFVKQLVSTIIHKILDLPTALDFSIVSNVSSLREELLPCLGHPLGKLNCILVGLKLKESILPKDSQLLIAQRYVHDFVNSNNWSDDSYCADVIEAGKKHKIDARGCLAELMVGMSYNIANVFSTLAWRILKDKNSELFIEIKKAIEDRQHMTDKEFVTDMQSRALYWINWTINNYSNLNLLLRIADNGEIFAVDLKSINDEHPDLHHSASFSMGRFACPGQYLARTTMLLSLKYMLSPIVFENKIYQFYSSPAGTITTKYNDFFHALIVEWTDDTLPLQAISS